MAQPNKKSFEFRMSKKVAELTQVVHMLFTRNHEKEVEIEALKDAYEYEIELVIQDARLKLDKAEKRVRDLEKENASGNSKAQNQIQESLAKKDEEWKSKVQNLEKQIEAERKETQNSRDLLIKAQKDIADLRKGQNSEVSKLMRDIADKSKEIDRLKDIIRQLEGNINEKHRQLSSANEVNKQNELLRKEIEKLKENVKTVEKTKEQVLIKNKQLENDIKNLRRELNKRVVEKNSAPSKLEREATHHVTGDYNEELERLRREIQRYRMELSNRETNFNRVFAEKNPLQTTHSGVARSNRNAMMQAFENGVVMRLARERTSHAMDLQRERTLPVANSPSRSFPEYREEFEEQYDIPTTGSPRSFSAALQQPHVNGRLGQNDTKLPQLNHSMDSKTRLQKLMKPKPLPREMLSTRAGGH